MSDGGASEAMRDAFIATHSHMKDMRATLQIVLAWLERKPTPSGRTYGHGSQEMRDLIRKALDG